MWLLINYSLLVVT